MTHDRAPATDAELRFAYRRSKLQAHGIPFERAIEEPALRTVLQIGVIQQRKKRDRLDRIPPGTGIERSQPEFSNTPAAQP